MTTHVLFCCSFATVFLSHYSIIERKLIYSCGLLSNRLHAHTAELCCCSSDWLSILPTLPVRGHGGLCYPRSAGPRPRVLGQRSGGCAAQGLRGGGAEGRREGRVRAGGWRRRGWEGGGEGGASGDGCRPRLGRARCQGLSGAPSLSGSLPRTPSWAPQRGAGIHGQCKTGPSAPLPLAPAHASAPTITCSIGTLWK